MHGIMDFTKYQQIKNLLNFEWKLKRINNADLFSQPPLLMFTKSANISWGHCISEVGSNELHLIHYIYLSNFVRVSNTFWVY